MNPKSDYTEMARVAAKGSRPADSPRIAKHAGNKFCSRLGMGVAVLAILLWPGSKVFGSAYYDTYGNYNPTNAGDTGEYDASDSSNTHVSFSRPVGSLFSIGAGKSYATTSGYADAGSLKLGVSGWAVSKPGNAVFTDAYMETGASNSFTVSPGTSGLSIGAATTLQLKIRLDGSLSTDARSWPGSSWAHADMSAELTIRDYAIQVYNEGWWSPPVASFGASSELEAYDVYKPYWGYAYSSEWEESWSMESNITSGTSHNASATTTQLGESMYYTGVGHYFDTGYLTLSFEAIVGHTLDVDAYLYSYVNANHEAEAWSDFDNTFAFDVTSAVTGLQIDWEIPVQTSQPVPDSGGLLLVGTALLCLLGLHRIRAAKHE